MIAIYRYLDFRSLNTTTGFDEFHMKVFEMDTHESYSLH
jgi:hypothetical protein